jgi:hypothetical protein
MAKSCILGNNENSSRIWFGKLSTGLSPNRGKPQSESSRSQLFLSEIKADCKTCKVRKPEGGKNGIEQDAAGWSILFLAPAKGFRILHVQQAAPSSGIR